jgi:hypothetical protein
VSRRNRNPRHRRGLSLRTGLVQAFSLHPNACKFYFDAESGGFAGEHDELKLAEDFSTSND